MKTTTKIVYLLLGALVLACFALSPQAQADCREGCDIPNGNTFLGDNAFLNATGHLNTAIGSNTLETNTTGNNNTATGSHALYQNITGINNTAAGVSALVLNTGGYANTANGVSALQDNTIGNYNTANGYFALGSNTTGNYNTADGSAALLSNTTGSLNVGIGVNAGRALTTGSGNVCIGVNVYGVAGESNTTRIRNVYSSMASGRAVYVTSGNKIGTLASSRRFKEEIKPMEKASESILALQPVTFRYKKQIDANGTKQFGLIAEEVEKVNPELVTCDENGKPQSVRYEAINAMLLNEFLKEHRAVQVQEGIIAQVKSNAARQEATIADLKSEMRALTAMVKEKASEIQKVNAQCKVTKAAPQMIINNP